jgi:hypothetical protein
MISGFAQQASVVNGDDLVLHVSTDAPAFRVDLYRYGSGMEFVARSDWFPGQDVPDQLPYQDWTRDGVGLHGEALAPWPAYALRVGDDWRTGVYVAVLVEGDGGGRDRGAPDPRTPDGRDSKALFVVTSSASPAENTILYKLPLFTYHAYNRVSPAPYDPATQQGAWSLYTVPEPRHLPVAVPPTVNLRRPGGGTGGTPIDHDNFDPFDPTLRQTFVHWDAPFIAWMERNSYALDYCTDVDLHSDAELLGRYRLLVSAGHDEYWTDAMRGHAEAFVAGGGNIAFFSGNTCWWRVTFDDESSFRRVAFWSDPDGPDRPENALTGVSFRNGGERDRDEHPLPVGYRVQHADHWVYEGSGLGDGDVFGGGPDEYLVGYECDGAHFDRALLDRGRPVEPTGDDGTPSTFAILGIGDVRKSGWGMGNQAATMGVYTRNGTVFNAATTDWARLLRGRPHPVIEQITRNVLDRLSGQGG